MMYDVSWQGLLEECELVFRSIEWIMLRGQRGNVSPLPFWEVGHFPYRQLCVRGGEKSIVGNSHWISVSVCWAVCFFVGGRLFQS